MLRLLCRKLARPVEAPALANQPLGQLHVPWLGELAQDEGLQLRVLLRRVEHRRGGQAGAKVMQRRLAQRLAAAGEVQQVIHQLQEAPRQSGQRGA